MGVSYDGLLCRLDSTLLLSNKLISQISQTLGGLLVNPLCGEPILGAVGDSIKLTIATLLW